MPVILDTSNPKIKWINYEKPKERYWIKWVYLPSVDTLYAAFTFNEKFDEENNGTIHHFMLLGDASDTETSWNAININQYEGDDACGGNWKEGLGVSMQWYSKDATNTARGQELAADIGNIYRDMWHQLTKTSKLATQLNVIQDYSAAPEERHDAWIYDRENKTLYFLHGGHHAEIFENWIDPDDADNREIWMGDIENGTIRFYENMRARWQPWDTTEFREIITQVKNLSDDYSPDDIGIDYRSEASYVKQSFNGEELYRWLYDPINGLTVWPFIRGDDVLNHHSRMLTKLLGPDYYEYDNYTGGYIDSPNEAHPFGTIRQTYKAYVDPTVNYDGIKVLTAWLEGYQQAQLPPQYSPKGLDFSEDPRFKQSFVDQLEERMRWIYAPHHGGLHVWPFYQKNHGDVLDDLGIYDYLPIDPDSPLSVDPDWCGGYIERDGKVWMTYDAPSKQTNAAGFWAAKAWVVQQLEPPIQGLAKKKKFKQRERVILPQADYKWAYTPGGELDVWPVDPNGEPQHYIHRGPQSFTEEAQGHIYDLGSQYAIYTHPTRPQMQQGEGFAAWQARQEALQQQASPAVENYIRTNLQHDPDKIISKRQKPFKPRKRRHIRKHQICMYLGVPYPSSEAFEAPEDEPVEND